MLTTGAEQKNCVAARARHSAVLIERLSHNAVADWPSNSGNGLGARSCEKIVPIKIFGAG